MRTTIKNLIVPECVRGMVQHYFCWIETHSLYILHIQLILSIQGRLYDGYYSISGTIVLFNTLYTIHIQTDNISFRCIQLLAVCLQYFYMYSTLYGMYCTVFVIIGTVKNIFRTFSNRFTIEEGNYCKNNNRFLKHQQY